VFRGLTILRKPFILRYLCELEAGSESSLASIFAAMLYNERIAKHNADAFGRNYGAVGESKRRKEKK